MAINVIGEDAFFSSIKILEAVLTLVSVLSLRWVVDRLNLNLEDLAKDREGLRDLDANRPNLKDPVVAVITCVDAVDNNDFTVDLFYSVFEREDNHYCRSGIAVIISKQRSKQ